MSIATMRAAIASAITSGCADWRGIDHVPDQINPPIIVVDFEYGDQIAFGPVGSVAHDLTLTLMAFAQRESNRAGQKLLDVLRDPTDSTSLWQVLAASSVGNYARITNASAVRVADIGQTSFLVVEFTGEVAV